MKAKGLRRKHGYRGRLLHAATNSVPDRKDVDRQRANPVQNDNPQGIQGRLIKDFLLRLLKKKKDEEPENA